MLLSQQKHIKTPELRNIIEILVLNFQLSPRYRIIIIYYTKSA